MLCHLRTLVLSFSKKLEVLIKTLKASACGMIILTQQKALVTPCNGRRTPLLSECHKSAQVCTCTFRVGLGGPSKRNRLETHTRTHSHTLKRTMIAFKWPLKVESSYLTWQDQSPLCRSSHKRANLHSHLLSHTVNDKVTSENLYLRKQLISQNRVIMTQESWPISSPLALLWDHHLFILFALFRSWYVCL